MDIALVETIKVLGSDFIKIVGPAIVAAYATYKATSIQFEMKLKEMEGAHAFKAREHLLEYYKTQISKLAASANSLNASLGYVLGITTAIDLEGENEDAELVRPHIAIADLYIGMVKFDCSSTLKEMENSGLESSDEFFKLEEYKNLAYDLNISTEIETVKKNIFSLLEIYNFLAKCNQMVLEQQVKNLFKPYV